MSDEMKPLPDEFDDLTSHLGWALASQQERCRARQSATQAELQFFYDVMMPRMEAVLQYLARFRIDDFPADVGNLFHMTLSLAEIAPAIENFGQPQVVDGYDVFRFLPVDPYPSGTTGPR
jgi:hypothetical protein